MSVRFSSVQRSGRGEIRSRLSGLEMLAPSFDVGYDHKTTRPDRDAVLCLPQAPLPPET
jgi:hypothetical protein